MTTVKQSSSQGIFKVSGVSKFPTSQSFRNPVVIDISDLLKNTSAPSKKWRSTRNGLALTV